MLASSNVVLNMDASRSVCPGVLHVEWNLEGSLLFDESARFTVMILI